MERRLRFGVSTPAGAFGLDEVADVAMVCGRTPDIVLWYEDFAAAPPSTGVDAVASTGAAPLITWEPWLWRTDAAAASVSLTAAIAAGDVEDHLISWAKGLGRVEAEVWLRFGHEFNGDWYPWSPTGGTLPDVYVAAWRHLRETFDAHGATNVRWVWSPAAVSSEQPLEAWYPGDDYVDLVGLDGYNWGTSREWSRWMDPAEIFEPTLADARRVCPDKPVLIAEVACAEAGGDKAAWITEFVRWVARTPAVEGFVWFDHDKETDWRITSSPRSAAAMAAALDEVRA
jgi:beta-mannanase